MDNVVERMNGLLKKASMLSSIHSEEHNRLRLINRNFTLASLFSSVFLLMLSLAPIEELIRFVPVGDFQISLILAFLAFTSLCISLYLLIASPGERAASNAEEMKRYLKVKKLLKERIRNGLDEDPSFLTSVSKIYMEGDGEPLIDNERFLNLKKKYYLNLSYSKAVEDNPVLTLRSHIKFLKKNEGANNVG